jgi:hypothetical protein
VRDPRGAGPHAAERHGSAASASSKFLTGCGQRAVATNVVAVPARVEDEPDRLVGELTDGGDHRGRACTRAAVHQDDAVGSNLDGDISTIAGNHVDVALDVDHFETVVERRHPGRNRGRLLLGNQLRRGPLRICRKPDGQQPQHHHEHTRNLHRRRD